MFVYNKTLVIDKLTGNKNDWLKILITHPDWITLWWYEHHARAITKHTCMYVESSMKMEYKLSKTTEWKTKLYDEVMFL